MRGKERHGNVYVLQFDFLLEEKAGPKGGIFLSPDGF
jgi:hypothetical protein